ncbi:MAG: hypothetical protein ACFFBI_11175 [Promethearchaeota archaeon]
MTEKQKSNNPSSKSSGCLKRKKFNQKIKSQLKNYPKDIEKISSLRQFSRDTGVPRPKIKEWILDFLQKNYKDQAIRVYEEVWLYRQPAYDQSPSKQALIENFVQIVETQLRNYPNNLKEILSLNEMARILGIERNTITDWLQKYLAQKYSSRKVALKIYKECWTIKKGTSRKVTYNRIQEFLENRHATLLTSKQDFLEMSEKPSARMVEVRCEHGHSWTIRVYDLLFKGRWCPGCMEPSTQKVMRLFMESIFGGSFPETSLMQTFGIGRDQGGSLRFDGYNGEIKINGKNYKVAFEYDGSQHDIWPNPYHRTRSQFKRQQFNDQRKNDIARDFGIVLIRLKEIDGFDYYHLHRFEREILEQFYQQTGARLMLRNRYYNIHSNLIIFAKGPIDKFLGYEVKLKGKKLRERSDFLEYLARYHGFRVEKRKIRKGIILRFFGDSQEQVEDFVLYCNNNYILY